MSVSESTSDCVCVCSLVFCLCMLACIVYMHTCVHVCIHVYCITAGMCSWVYTCVLVAVPLSWKWVYVFWSHFQRYPRPSDPPPHFSPLWHRKEQGNWGPSRGRSPTHGSWAMALWLRKPARPHEGVQELQRQLLTQNRKPWRVSHTAWRCWDAGPEPNPICAALILTQQLLVAHDMRWQDTQPPIGVVVWGGGMKLRNHPVDKAWRAWLAQSQDSSTGDLGCIPGVRQTQMHVNILTGKQPGHLSPEYRMVGEAD
jgi:hypothetical protein